MEREMNNGELWEVITSLLYTIPVTEESLITWINGEDRWKNGLMAFLHLFEAIGLIILIDDVNGR